MAGRLVVTGALIVAKREDGSDVYLRAGDTVPDSVTADHVQHLKDMGLVESASDDSPKTSSKRK